MDYYEALYQARVNNRRLDSAIKEIAFIEEARITYHNTELIKYMNLLYNKAMYHYLRGVFHASPGLWAILVAIWGVIVFIYNAVVFIIDLLKIKEILQIAQILRIVWPKFREKYDKIMGKISEFSQQVGWGTDGLIHLIQAAQGGLSVIKGVTGKSFEWLQIAGAEKALRALAVVSAKSHEIATNPASVIDLAFSIPSEETSREVKTWWDDTFDWLTKTADTAETAIQNVNDIIDNLLELENKLPDFIRKNIPKEIWDSINWADEKIDNTILPALTAISDQFTQINTELQAERLKAQFLAAQLMLPGNLLTNVDKLIPMAKLDQEQKIDDITSREYERQTDIIYQSDQEVITGLESIQALVALDIPEPAFIALETTGRPGILWDKAELVDGWFVGDF